MDTNLLEILVADNPWLGGGKLQPWLGNKVPKDFVPRGVRLGQGQRIQLLVGPRQAGKSTLVWWTLANIGRPVLFLNCEETAIQQWLHSPALFVSQLPQLAPGIDQVFLEEAQHLPEAGLFLKGVFDRRPDLRVFVTGSSSFHLEAATRESLAGRADRHLLLPFSIQEVAGPKLPKAPLLRQRALAEAARKALIFGGYPSVLASSSKELELGRLVEAFVLRDASDRFRIRHLAAFRKLLELAAAQVGQLVNLSEWAALTEISRETVRDYLQLLEDSHLLRVIKPFAGGRRVELTSASKVYFLDNGLRNRLLGAFSSAELRPDSGPLFENLVFTELARATNPILDTISFWRSKSGAEVDFIVGRQGAILPVEVKLTERSPRLSRSMRSFLEAYRPPKMLLVSQDGQGQQQVGETLVKLIPIHALAAEAVEEPA